MSVPPMIPLGTVIGPSDTTPAIEKANRLLGLRAHPGFTDVVRLSQDLCEEAAKAVADFPGWDPMMIVILKVRLQVAREYHDMFFNRINDKIAEGIAEAKSRDEMLVERAKTESDRIQEAAAALDSADLVRVEVLKQFNEMDEMRPAGSY